MHLVYYVYLIFSALWCKTYLVGQVSDVIYRIVAGSIQLKDVERGIVLEALAGITYATGFHIGGRVLAIDGFSKDTGAGGFTYPTRTTKQVCMRQMLVADSIL